MTDRKLWTSLKKKPISQRHKAISLLFLVFSNSWFLFEWKTRFWKVSAMYLTLGFQWKLIIFLCWTMQFLISCCHALSYKFQICSTVWDAKCLPEHKKSSFEVKIESRTGSLLILIIWLSQKSGFTFFFYSKKQGLHLLRRVLWSGGWAGHRSAIMCQPGQLPWLFLEHAWGHSSVVGIPQNGNQGLHSLFSGK